MRNSQFSCGQRMAKWAALLAGLLLAGQAASLQAAVPAAKVTAVQAQAGTAAAVELEGELEVQHEDDFENKKSRTRHFLKTESGERYELHFKGDKPHHPSGTKLRVRGAKSGSILYLDSSSSVQVMALASPSTLGEHKVLVMMVNFQDNATQPFTLADASSVVFTQTNNFMRENSSQQTWISGNAYGWYTLPITSTCDSFQIISHGEQAATAAGINLANYSHHVYVMPKNMSCGWSGSGTMGGVPANIVINGSLEAKVVAHEFGHNLGLDHSHGLNCGTGTIGSSCTSIEYGDAADVMGNTGAGHFNAFQKERLGWLNNGTMPTITTVQNSGSYTLEPYETASGNPKALKVLKSVDSVTGVRTWYYIEYRQAIGFDAYLATLPISNYMTGVVIRTGSESGSGTSFLLDMTPNSDSTSWDWYDAALTSGVSFSDSTAGVTITTTWTNGAGAGVDIQLANSTSCTHANPSVVMSSSQNSLVAVGTVVAYTVALTNNDSSACAASTFNLQPNVPAGWSGTLGSPALTVSPGGASSTTLSVASASTAVAGTYSVGVTATNNSASSASASASYTIASATSANLSTSVMTDKASYNKGSTVQITSTVMLNSKPVTNASVAFSVTKPNGTVVSQSIITDSKGQAVYQMRLSKQKDPAGMYQVKGIASSSGSSASASTSFLVQ
ncbi:peptidase M11 [Vogesella sp. GCM10023246]|uniref:Peptidase M11 n=1 Tax=Vogesella oryzagri TaxID=3160864 RepID=A0ABV1M7D5_9NEIS